MFKNGSLIALATVLTALSFPAEARASVTEDLNCLALNIYFEARSEPLDGKLAVGFVVLNRVADKRFPSKICDVVKQGGESRLHKCQFSWWCDGRSDKPHNPQAWKESRVVARLVYWGYAEDPTGGALWYHADYVRPIWRHDLVPGPVIGRHQFYLPPNSRVAKVQQKGGDASDNSG